MISMNLFGKDKDAQRRLKAGDSEAITSIIDKEMKIAGDVSFQGKTLLDGRVEGNVSGEYLIISETGSVIGDVKADVVICQGRVKGNIKASQLHAKNSAQISGAVEVNELAVEFGVLLNGDVKANSKDLRLVEGGGEPQQQKPVVQKTMVKKESEAAAGK